MYMDLDKEKYFIAGLFAGEGTFYANARVSNYGICIEFHVRDKKTLLWMQKVLGFGTVRQYPSKPKMVRFQAGGITFSKAVLIPFFDEYLIYSYKKVQYLEWRKKVLLHKQVRTEKRNVRKSAGNKFLD